MSKLAKGESDEDFQAIKPGTSQKKAFTGTSSQSSAVGANTTIVRLLATEDCFVLFGANPTALADGSNLFLKANVPEYFGIVPGHKIGVIRLSSDGDLYITEGE